MVDGPAREGPGGRGASSVPWEEVAAWSFS